MATTETIPDLTSELRSLTLAVLRLCLAVDPFAREPTLTETQTICRNVLARIDEKNEEPPADLAANESTAATADRLRATFQHYGVTAEGIEEILQSAGIVPKKPTPPAKDGSIEARRFYQARDNEKPSPASVVYDLGPVEGCPCSFCELQRSRGLPPRFGVGQHQTAPPPVDLAHVRAELMKLSDDLTTPAPPMAAGFPVDCAKLRLNTLLDYLGQRGIS